MQRRQSIFAIALLPLAAVAQTRPSLRLSVSSSGEMRVDHKPVDLAALDRMLEELKRRGGEVWYYRQSSATEPPPQAMEAIKLIIKYSLPITMSTKPDFSDYVDVQGNSHPRN
jgi:biopolymer transport protein ExbD